MSRSQRHLRFGRGYDSAWDPAYMFGEPSKADPVETYDLLTDSGWNKPRAPAVSADGITVALAGGVFTCSDPSVIMLGEGTFRYQWFVNSALKPGATSASYTFAGGDLGKFHTCRVMLDDPAGPGYSYSNSVRAA